MKWSDAAIERLNDARLCPLCEMSHVVQGRCAYCGADLSGPQGVALWNASTVAAESLRAREALLATVPRLVPVPTAVGVIAPPMAEAGHPAVVQTGPPAAAQAGPVRGAVGAQPLRPSPPATDGASLQSVLATAGAGLFAVAAIVFTFFNPELADRAVRSWIIAGVTLAFLGGAWLLARRRLQSSAEAVGGLGLVFVGLDVQAVAGSFPGAGSAWTSAAIATAAAGLLMLAAALRARIRIWLWTSLLGLAAAPAMLGFAAQTGVGGALWLAASAFAATGLMALLPRFAPRFPVRDEGPDADGETPSTAEPVLMGSGPAERAAASERPDAVADAATGLASRRPFAAELAALTALQVLVTILAIGRVVLTGATALSIAAVLAVLAVHAVLATTRTIPRTWAFAAGVLITGAGAFAASGLLQSASIDYSWFIAFPPAGAVIALILCALVPLPQRTSRIPMAVGAGLAAGVTSAPAVITGGFVGTTLLRFAVADTAGGGSAPVLGSGTWAMLLSLALIAAGFGAFALCTRVRPDIRPLRSAALVVTVLYSTAAVLCLAASHVLPLPIGIAAVLIAAAGTALVLARIRPAAAAAGAVAETTPDVAPGVAARKAPAWTSLRVLLVIAVHLALVVAVLLSWQERALVPYAGIATLVVLAAAALTVPEAARFLHVGIGYAYALVLVGTALSLAGVGGVALLSLTASAGLLGAVVATFLPVVHARNWQTVLVVATVPFALGVAQVVFERSGWTALSTGLMFVLALALLLTRREGLTVVIRTVAAGLLVPTLAVVILCLGAQLLVRSGSPVVLPIIAAVIALVLPSGRMIRDGLVARGRIAATADAARVAIEGSALLTGAIAVLLALAREAAGFGTACLVLILLGVGAALTSLLAGRRYGWWVAGLAFTGALWSLWALNGVQLAEAYLLPPALAAALIAALLALRGTRAVPLFAAGLAGAIIPVLVLLIAGRGTDEVPWRAHALLASAWVLLALAALVSRAPGPRTRRLRPLRPTAILLASVAALGGTAQAVRWGSGLDRSPVLGGDAGLFLLCVGSSALAALALLVAARMLRSAASDAPAALAAARWLTVPGALAFGIGVWPAIAEDWFVIWGMWTLMLGWLALMVLTARRSSTTLPPVWVLFGLAFITAVVAWSPRELRVETFSLPLGLFLLAAGALGLRSAGGARGADAVGADRKRDVPGVDAWPHGWRGSWPLLAPGLIVMMSASVVSTFTDPLTWRAILVMVLALAAILVGAARRLAAPFVIGLIVLPVENVFVFAVQLGRGIESMPWWITLATIGAVLLIIAVAGERREGADRSVVARMRDLR
ncbi:SCO7613 C-terminal domain-containing membrane protein [Microbacterium arabinogalactanolyticum]|uniref:SCO7613 C-terminal domain-containing membrane protein n=1 Tax=Microbacterium arabinogalactanolyticum TaxID=69365 RepID=UPI004043D42D